MKKMLFSLITLSLMQNLGAMDAYSDLSQESKVQLFKRMCAIAGWIKQSDMPFNVIGTLMIRSKECQSFRKGISQASGEYSLTRQQLQKYICQNPLLAQQQGQIDEYVAEIHDIEDRIGGFEYHLENAIESYSKLVKSAIQQYPSTDKDLQETPPRIIEMYFMATININNK